MLLFLAASAVLGCNNSTPEAAAASVLTSLKTGSFACLNEMMVNPEVKFSGPDLDPSVIDSLKFRSKGNLSYLDIVRRGVKVDVTGSGEKRSAFYVLDSDWKSYVRNKQQFKKRYFMKKYFVCNIVKDGSAWKITQDFCFTEGD